MTTDRQKRDYVNNLYSAKRWKKMVADMSDDRVAAIYNDHQKDPTPKSKRHYRELEVEALPLPKPPESLMGPRDPHRNEDDFPLI